MAEERDVFRLDFEGSDDIVHALGKIKTAQAALKQNNKELKKEVEGGSLSAAKAYARNEAQIKSYGKQANELSKELQGVEKTSKGLRTELTKKRKTLQEMAAAGKEGTKEFKDLRDEASQLQDTVDKVQAEIKFFADDMAVVRGLADTAQLVGHGFQIAQGAAHWFGVENDKLVESIAKLQGIMAITNSMQQASNLLRKESRVILLGKVAATKVATVVQAAWNKVVSANPLMMLVLAIGAVVGGIVLLVKNIKGVLGWFGKLGSAVRKFASWLGISTKATEEQTEAEKEAAAAKKAHEDAINNTRKALEKLREESKLRNREIDREIALLESLGGKEEEIIQIKEDKLRLSVQEARMALELYKLERKATLTMIERYRAMGQEVPGILKNVADEYEELNQTVLDLENNLEIHFNKEERRLRKLREEKRKELERMSADAEKARLKELDAAKKAAIEEEKARLELAVKFAATEEEKLQAQIERIRRLAEIDIETKEYTESQKILIRLNALEEEEKLANEFAERELEVRRQLAEEQRLIDEEIELEKQQAHEKELQRLAELEQFERDMMDARLDAARGFTDAMTSLLGEQAEASEAVKAVHKTLGVAEIGINLERELSAIWAEAAKMGPAGTALAALQSVAAVGRSVAATASILALNRGGSVPGTGNTDSVPAMLTPGEGVLRKPAMESRQVYSLTGTPKQIASHLNQAHGGVQFLNRGGVVGQSAAISSNAVTEQTRQLQVMDALKDLQIITTIEDVNAGLGRESLRNNISTYA